MILFGSAVTYKKKKQSFRIGKHISNKLEVSYGVPQGSVLGPVLFLVYVNDLSQCISDCLVIQYADDTQFTHTGCIDRLRDLIQEEEETLSKAKHYFTSSGLLINTKKYHYRKRKKIRKKENS